MTRSGTTLKTALSGEGQDAPSVDKMACGQRFLALDRVDKERVPAWRADLPPYALSNALRVVIISNGDVPMSVENGVAGITG